DRARGRYVPRCREGLRGDALRLGAPAQDRRRARARLHPRHARVVRDRRGGEGHAHPPRGGGRLRLGSARVGPRRADPRLVGAQRAPGSVGDRAADARGRARQGARSRLGSRAESPDPPRGHGRYFFLVVVAFAWPPAFSSIEVAVIRYMIVTLSPFLTSAPVA